LPLGKLAAQVAHAAVGAFLEAGSSERSAWLAEGMPKIVLVGASAAHLGELQALARAAGLPAMLVQDAGRTVVPEGSVTCLGIGPARDEALAKLTGTLPLL
jgi:peptidyl-tRNA hydrolase